MYGRGSRELKNKRTTGAVSRKVVSRKRSITVFKEDKEQMYTLVTWSG